MAVTYRENQFLLLKSRRFAPLFATQFLGAFHDNLFKNAFIVLLLFDSNLQTEPVHNAKLLTTLAAGIFILPFILFSGIGGQLADKLSKDYVIRKIKIAELVIAFFGILSLFSNAVFLSFFTLFLLGAHSAFFGPSKYSLLPVHLESKELIGGNALLNTGTFLAILAGTIAGTGLITQPDGKMIVSIMILACSLLGYGASRFIPPAPINDQYLKIQFKPFREIFDILRRDLASSQCVRAALLGIAWFWFLGGLFMAQLPNFVHDTLKADEYALTALLILFSVGIGIGGLLNNRLLKGQIRAAFAPLAAAGITLFSIDLYFASYGISGYLPARIGLDFFMIAVCGGLFVVPLNALVQNRTPEAERARVMAGNAIINALFVVASSIFSALLIVAGFEIREIFLIFSIVNLFIALYLFKRRI